MKTMLLVGGSCNPQVLEAIGVACRNKIFGKANATSKNDIKAAVRIGRTFSLFSSAAAT